MKKLILAIGILLMSASVFANHLTGLKQHQAGQSTTGQQIQLGSQTPIAQAVFTKQSKQRNIITDPQSCIDRWGDNCIDPVVFEPIALDLGDTTIQEHLVQHDKGESPESIVIGDELDLTIGSTDEIDLSIGATTE